MEIQVSWECCKILNNMKKNSKSFKEKNHSCDCWALSYKQMKLNVSTSTIANNEKRPIIVLLKHVWTNEFQGVCVQSKSHMSFISTCSFLRQSLKWAHISNLETNIPMFTPTFVNLGWPTYNSLSPKVLVSNTAHKRSDSRRSLSMLFPPKLWYITKGRFKFEKHNWSQLRL